MKIIVGLGNPGRKYERTRHNAGFMATDELARNLHIEVAQEKYHALVGRARIDSEEAVLAKPQTYMNESGRAVGAILRGTYTAVSDIIVIHDELDLPLGAVKIKTGGGARASKATGRKPAKCSGRCARFPRQTPWTPGTAGCSTAAMRTITCWGSSGRKPKPRRLRRSWHGSCGRPSPWS